MAGWRVGMLSGKAESITSRFKSKKQYGFWNVFWNPTRSDRCFEG